MVTIQMAFDEDAVAFDELGGLHLNRSWQRNMTPPDLGHWDISPERVKEVEVILSYQLAT